MTTTPTTPPTIWYKAQRVLRTGLQALLSFLVLWATIALIAPEILTELAKFLPGSWIIWLTSAIAFVTVVAGALTRIMAIPAVNALLVKIGLGSVPKSAIIDGGTVRPDVAAVITSLPAQAPVGKIDLTSNLPANAPASTIASSTASDAVAAPEDPSPEVH